MSKNQHYILKPEKNSHVLFISDKHAVNTEMFNAKPRDTSTQWLKVKYHFLRHWRGLTSTGEMYTPGKCEENYNGNHVKFPNWDYK